MTNISNSGLERHKNEFLAMFPDDCQTDCIVARIAAAQAAKSYMESTELTYASYVEHYVHRFGRCVVQPQVVGMCGKKSVCHNELIGGEESPVEAAEILVDF